jgi:hypothetical protein
MSHKPTSYHQNICAYNIERNKNMYIRVREYDKVPTLFQTQVFVKFISKHSYTQYQKNIQLVCINLEISFNNHIIILNFQI